MATPSNPFSSYCGAPVIDPLMSSSSSSPMQSTTNQLHPTDHHQQQTLIHQQSIDAQQSVGITSHLDTMTTNNDMTSIAVDVK